MALEAEHSSVSFQKVLTSVHTHTQLLLAHTPGPPSCSGLHRLSGIFRVLICTACRLCFPWNNWREAAGSLGTAQVQCPRELPLMLSRSTASRLATRPGGCQAPFNAIMKADFHGSCWRRDASLPLQASIFTVSIISTNHKRLVHTQTCTCTSTTTHIDLECRLNTKRCFFITKASWCPASVDAMCDGPGSTGISSRNSLFLLNSQWPGWWWLVAAALPSPHVGCAASRGGPAPCPPYLRRGTDVLGLREEGDGLPFPHSALVIGVQVLLGPGARVQPVVTPPHAGVWGQALVRWEELPD